MPFSTLSIGASALNAAQRAVETAAHDANSTVEGYTRQRVALAASQPGAGSAGVRGSGMRGTGAQVVAIERLRSALCDLAVRAEAGTAGSSGAPRRRPGPSAGHPRTVRGRAAPSLTTMWDAFSALASNPAGPAARQAVLDTADRVAGGLRDAADELTQIRGRTAGACTYPDYSDYYLAAVIGGLLGRPVDLANTATAATLLGPATRYPEWFADTAGLLARQASPGQAD